MRRYPRVHATVKDTDTLLPAGADLPQGLFTPTKRHEHATITDTIKTRPPLLNKNLPSKGRQATEDQDGAVLSGTR